MNSIDYEALSNAVQEVIDENLLGKYDFEAILLIKWLSYG